MTDAREQIIQSGNEPTLGAVVERTAQTRPDLHAAAIQRVATEIVAAADNPAGNAARQAISREIATRLRIDPKVKQAMTAAFAVVLAEFRDATLKHSAVLASVGRQVHGVTGGQMREFAQRLRDAAPRPLTVEMILAWADAHHEATGEWPKVQSGAVTIAPEENWANVDQLLQRALRGLPDKSSIAKLLEAHRGVRNVSCPPSLTEGEILAWADAHHVRTGMWPNYNSGAVMESPEETWMSVHMALQNGNRGLPGESSLARLLAEFRGVRNVANLPPLSEPQILAWADAHRASTGDWPKSTSGPVADAPGETWAKIDGALQQGNRGLPEKSSLARLLADHRGRKNQLDPPPLSAEQILVWADAYHKSEGKWPKDVSGSIAEVPGETWAGIHSALVRGARGFPGGSTLARFLAEHRGVRNHKELPDLSIENILAWADAHYQLTGHWPTQQSGPIADASGEKWGSVDQALSTGLRGLSGGSSLAQLLAENRGKRNPKKLPALTLDQILAWAESHHQRTGVWPKQQSGTVADAPGETWAGIYDAFRNASRGLPSGWSLIRLLEQRRNGSA